MEWFRSADGSNKAANVERRRSRETPKATFESPSAVLCTTAVMLRDALKYGGRKRLWTSALGTVARVGAPDPAERCRLHNTFGKEW